MRKGFGCLKLQLLVNSLCLIIIIIINIIIIIIILIIIIHLFL